MSALFSPDDDPQTGDGDLAPLSYPAFPEDEILPTLPGDPIPNPEPEQPSLGVPDPGIYQGTGGTASVKSE
jgi:hypothetical protein